MSMCSAVSLCLSFNWVMYFVNGVQLLSATSIFSWPPVYFISRGTRVCASKQSQEFDLSFLPRT